MIFLSGRVSFYFDHFFVRLSKIFQVFLVIVTTFLQFGRQILNFYLKFPDSIFVLKIKIGKSRSRSISQRTSSVCLSPVRTSFSSSWKEEKEKRRSRKEQLCFFFVLTLIRSFFCRISSPKARDNSSSIFWLRF